MKWLSSRQRIYQGPLVLSFPQFSIQLFVSNHLDTERSIRPANLLPWTPLADLQPSSQAFPPSRAMFWNTAILWPVPETSWALGTRDTHHPREETGYWVVTNGHLGDGEVNTHPKCGVACPRQFVVQLYKWQLFKIEFTQKLLRLFPECCVYSQGTFLGKKKKIESNKVTV